MRPVEIKSDIFWVGAVDWSDIDFHGYALARNGTTYNAFLIKDEKTVLFDTVKKPYKDEFFNTLKQAINPEDIDYFVINHLEPDHAGCVLETYDLIKPEKVFVSPMGEKALKSIFHVDDWPLELMKTGSTLNLGKRNISFLETRMLHWPDNMVSYIPEEKLLISSDAFGQNWATSERFADEVDRSMLIRLMGEYFHNIVMPFAPIATKVLDQVADMGIEIDMIAPDHGLIFRGDDCAFAVEKYRELCAQKPSNRAVIIYDTMWHSTEKMAGHIADGLIDEGVSVKLMHVKSFHHSDVMSEVGKAGAVLVGSPTHNNGILPLMADVLTYMKGLKPQNKVAAAFGSYGWSGESPKVLNQWLEDMKFEVVEQPARILNNPNAEAVEQCVELGRAVGKALKAKL
jgi:flavorubredoxin